MRFHCIGDHDTVAGFRFAGVEGEVAESPAEARRALQRAADDADVGVIIMPDRMAAELEKEINDIRFNRTRPAIVEIPGPDGPLPGRPSLMDLIREAVGVRV
jgi:V/A-type H+/Na+-transporting ATPase subunit F